MADNGEALAKEKGNESSLALAKHWNSTSWARAMPQKLNSRLSFFYWHSDACENTINKIKKKTTASGNQNAPERNSRRGAGNGGLQPDSPSQRGRLQGRDVRQGGDLAPRGGRGDLWADGGDPPGAKGRANNTQPEKFAHGCKNVGIGIGIDIDFDISNETSQKRSFGTF